MASGTRQGGRPTFLHLDLGKLRRGPRRNSVCAAASLAFAMLLAGGDRAAPSQKIPYGMVPYTHPVYKNGKRILWHGAWRGSLGKYARRGVRAAEVKPALALAPEPPPQALAGKEFTILADPGDARASRMARDFATVMSASGTPGRAIVGSTSPNGLGKVLRTDMADFAIVSLDSLLFSAKGDSAWMKRSPFVARLAPETLVVIAPRDIKSLKDLQGKTVSFGDPDSSTSTSGRMLFSRLGVNANRTNEPLPEALDRLAAGKVDAVVVLGGEAWPALAISRRRALSHRRHSLVAGPGVRLRPRARDRRRAAQSGQCDQSCGDGRRADGARRPRRAPGSARAEAMGRSRRPSLTIITVSCATTIRIGAKSTLPPMLHRRPRHGPGSRRRKAGSMGKNRPPNRLSRPSAPPPSRPLNSAGGHRGGRIGSRQPDALARSGAIGEAKAGHFVESPLGRPRRIDRRHARHACWPRIELRPCT